MNITVEVGAQDVPLLRCTTLNVYLTLQLKPLVYAIWGPYYKGVTIRSSYKNSAPTAGYSCYRLARMHSTDDQPKTDQATDPSTNRPTDRRVSVAEAAVLLDLSEAAVRSRLRRGTLRKEKAKDGTVLVVLGIGASPDRQTNSTARPNDRSSTGQPTDQGDLVEVLRDQVVLLRQQLEEERDANRENRRIIAGLVQRVPELEPAQKPREEHVTDSEEPDKGSSMPSEQQELSQRRSWWRQFFGLE